LLPSERIEVCPGCGLPGVTVSDLKGTWQCSCGAGGDLFDYVMKDKGVNFTDALRYLAEAEADT